MTTKLIAGRGSQPDRTAHLPHCMHAKVLTEDRVGGSGCSLPPLRRAVPPLVRLLWDLGPCRHGRHGRHGRLRRLSELYGNGDVW